MEIEAEIKEEVMEEAKEDSNLIEPLMTPPKMKRGVWSQQNSI